MRQSGGGALRRNGASERPSTWEPTRAPARYPVPGFVMTTLAMLPLSSMVVFAVAPERVLVRPATDQELQMAR